MSTNVGDQLIGSLWDPMIMSGLVLMPKGGVVVLRVFGTGVLLPMWK